MELDSELPAESEVTLPEESVYEESQDILPEDEGILSEDSISEDAIESESMYPEAEENQ